MVPPNSAQPTESETTEFGPWMLVAKRQRRPAHMPQSSSHRHVEKQPLGSRFNPVSELREDAMGFGEDHAPRHLSVAMESAIVPQQQGRATNDARHQRAIPVRKPLTIADFSIVSRAAPKAGSSRANSGKNSSVVLEKSHHLAVVISENSNPNCPAMEVDHVAPTTSHNSLTRGKPPDSCANLPIGSSMGPLNVVHSDPVANMVPKPFVHCRITDKRCGSSTLATVVYGSLNATKRKALWSNLRHLASSIRQSWVLLGDFNATIFAEDRVSTSSMKPSGPPMMTLAEWWLTIGYLRLLFKRLLFLSQRRPTLGMIQFMVVLLLLELEGILDQEELIWRQKSCSDWIVLGDRNTQYFHRRAICRKQKQRITSLQLPNGEWCDDADSLRAVAADYFKTLFAADVRPPNRLPVHGCFPRLPQADGCLLMLGVSL
ncbi:hypothetical protein V6N13_046276 [Hibiscus sabdariffa]